MVSPSDDPLIGTLLADTYRVQARVAAGGMGVLYRARHIRLDTPVALKVLRQPVTAGSVAHRRFAREVRALTRMRSDRVVHVLDTFTLGDGRPCLVSEFIPGEDLHGVLGKHGPLTPKQAVALGLALAEGLAAAHEAGLVHRDIKPGNLMVLGRDFREAILIDFGVARVESADTLTREGTILGTPAYMAPEQLRDPRLSSPAADVYSAGAVLYHALAGESPFPTHPPTRSVAEVLAGPPPHLLSRAPAVPFRLAMLVDRAMSRAPEDRHADGAALSEALREVQSQLEPAAPRQGALSAALRNGVFALGAATGALSLGALFESAPAPLPGAWVAAGLGFSLTLLARRRARTVAEPAPRSESPGLHAASVEAATVRAE